MVCTENYTRQSNRNSSHSVVANPTVFLRGAQPADGSATYAQGDSSQLGSSYLGGSSSTSGSTEATGMQIIRRSLGDADIPPDVTDVIMHSWRHSTHKQYDHYIAKWVQFCSQGTCDPLCLTVKGLLMFLHSLYRKGMSYSSLNTARSAVSNLDFDIGQNPNHVSIGKHFLVSKYLKGVFHEIKPVPKYRSIWSVDPVLDYLFSLWPLDKLPLKELSLKLVLLVALTTGQRCQTLTFLDITTEYMAKSVDCYRFSLTEHIKQDRPGRVFGSLCLYKYTVKELCVYATLECYLNVTAKLRSSTKLFVSYIKPYGAVTASTIGRWIKTLLEQAGVDTKQFSAHSTRSASTSKAAASIPVDIILATAGWKEESTFRRFYNKPVAVTNQMSLAVLDR